MKEYIYLMLLRQCILAVRKVRGVRNCLSRSGRVSKCMAERDSRRGIDFKGSETGMISHSFNGNTWADVENYVLKIALKRHKVNMLERHSGVMIWSS